MSKHSITRTKIIEKIKFLKYQRDKLTYLNDRKHEIKDLNERISCLERTLAEFPINSIENSIQETALDLFKPIQEKPKAQDIIIKTFKDNPDIKISNKLLQLKINKYDPNFKLGSVRAAISKIRKNHVIDIEKITDGVYVLPTYANK